MKQKAGLGKKVSSIFDGVALPNIARPDQQAPPQAPPAYRPAEVISQPRPMPIAPPMPPMPLKPVPAFVPQPPRMMPSLPPSRLPARSVTAAASVNTVSGAAWQQLIHKMFFSGNGEADSRNRKTLAMAGILLVVFFFVAAWTGLFSGSPAGAGSAIGTAATEAASSETLIAWTPPEPYPGNLRDPMQVGSVSRASNGGDFTPGFGGFVVKSIVFSEDNPTAVINGQIVRVGQAINGATVTKINKDSVEFSANGKSWKQQVE